MNKYTKLPLIVIFLLFSNYSYAFLEANYETNSAIIKEIESSLLFDEGARQKIDVYNSDSSKRKSDYVINSNSPESAKVASPKKGSMKILLVDGNKQDFDLRKKEKLAYNSSLVGQYEVAIELFKQVLIKEPNNQYAKFSLAVIYQQIGESQKAKLIYRDILKDNPDNREEVIANLLAILIEENPQDASYLLSRLSIQNPNSSYILAQSAVVYDKLKKYSEAINLLKRALEIDPKNAGYLYNLAVAYDKNSQYDLALRSYEEAIRNYKEESNSLFSVNDVKARINVIRGAI